MSTDEQKKQLLSQKLFRKLKRKLKSTGSANDDNKPHKPDPKNPKIASCEENATDLTK